MKNGIYKTEKGSTLEISGKHSGIFEVNFDWFEEGACVDCKVNTEPDDGYLRWNCEICGGGKAKLHNKEEKNV